MDLVEVGFGKYKLEMGGEVVGVWGGGGLEKGKDEGCLYGGGSTAEELEGCNL